MQKINDLERSITTEIVCKFFIFGPWNLEACKVGGSVYHSLLP